MEVQVTAAKSFPANITAKVKGSWKSVNFATVSKTAGASGKQV